MMNLNISVSETLKEVYAASAMRCYVSANKSEKPVMLTPDRRGALRLLVRDAFCYVVVSMLPNVVTTSTGTDEDDEILSVSLDLPCEEGKVALICSLLQMAITAYVLHIVYVGSDEEFSREWSAKMERYVAKVNEYASGVRLKNVGRIVGQ